MKRCMHISWDYWLGHHKGKCSYKMSNSKENANVATRCQMLKQAWELSKGKNSEISIFKPIPSISQ